MTMPNHQNSVVSIIFSGSTRFRPNGTGCWVWTKVSRSGYGSVKIGGKQHLTHRLFYEYFNGPVPDGLQIDHLCRNRACCNPSHLEAVTRRENILRGVGVTALNARKTHCKNGHEFDLTNVVTRPNGGRSCRACGLIGTKAWLTKNPGLRRDNQRRYREKVRLLVAAPGETAAGFLSSPAVEIVVGNAAP